MMCIIHCIWTPIHIGEKGYSSADFQLCGDMDIVMIKHSSIQLPQNLAGLTDPGVNFFVQRRIDQDDTSQVFEAV